MISKALSFFLGLFILTECNQPEFNRPEIGETYIIEDAGCAGFHFVNDSILTWTNELFCKDSDTLFYNWISESTFITRQAKAHLEGCPPSIDIYRVLSHDEQGMVLLSPWTGWGTAQTDTIRFWRMHPIIH